jgi:hypothetical protein
MKVSEFYRNAEDLVLGVFKEQGGWRPMAVVLKQDGMGMIGIGDGSEDDDALAAAQLRKTLKINHVQSYVAAYIALKTRPDTDLGTERVVLGRIANTLDDADSIQESPDQMLFMFMSDNRGQGQVRVYSVIGGGSKIGPRQSWLEDAESPFHMLLADGPT